MTGWDFRESLAIEARLAEGAKRFGLAEHVILSPSKRDYGLTLPQLYAKAKKALYDRGFAGGCIIFHPARYNSPARAWRKGVSAGWYLSLHFHVLGFFLNGYSRCRHCPKIDPSNTHQDFSCCKGCSGFEGVTRRLNQGFVDDKGRMHEGDGFICKVGGERYSVFRTAYYQLSHAGFKIGGVRDHVVSWIGNMSYRKLHLTIEKRKSLCSICGSENQKVHYFGSRVFCCDEKLAEFKRVEICDMFENGVAVWVVAGDDDFCGHKPFKKLNPLLGFSRHGS